MHDDSLSIAAGFNSTERKHTEYDRDAHPKSGAAHGRRHDTS